MYDLPEKYTLCGKIENAYKSDKNTYKGNIGNMGIFHNPNCLDTVSKG
jgi:hypothetical protein